MVSNGSRPALHVFLPPPSFFAHAQLQHVRACDLRERTHSNIGANGVHLRCRRWTPRPHVLRCDVCSHTFPLNRVLWVTFFILHLDKFLRNGRAVTPVSFFPSLLLYSSIDHTLANSYGAFVVTSTITLFAFAGGKLVYEVLWPRTFA